MSITKLALAMLLGTANSAPANQGLEVTLSADCQEYQAGDPIVLDVRITNTHRNPVTLYGRLGWGLLSGLSLEIKDSTGKEIQPKFLDHDMPVPSTFDDRTYYLTLQRGHFFGVTRRDTIEQLFPAPGAYTLQVLYRSPIPAAMEPLVSDTVVREDGVVASNQIVIMVGPTACRPTGTRPNNSFKPKPLRGSA